MAIGFDMWNAKVDAVKDKLPDFQYQYFKNWRPDAPVGDLRGFSYGQQIYSITNKLNEAVKDPVAFAKTMLQKEGGNSATAYINGVKYDASRIKPIADYLRQNGVSTADMQGIVKSGQDNIVKFYQDMADRQSSRGNALDFLLPAVFAFVAPQIGAEIAASLGVSAAAGTAIASTAIQVANGTDIETAIENAVTNAVVQTGSTAVATEINTAMSNLPPQTAAAISNAAGSALASAATTAAKGGSTQEIINNAVAGAAGSGVASETGILPLGGAVTGGLTGGTTGALMGAAGALGRDEAANIQTSPSAPATTPETPDITVETPSIEAPTPAETGGLPPVSGTPAEGTAAVGEIPTEPAPQEIQIPDQITQVSEVPVLPEVTVTAPGYEPELMTTDRQIMDLTGITPPTTPSVPADVPVLEEITVTPPPYEPELLVPETPPVAVAETTPSAEAPPEQEPLEEIAPTPYKPEFFVAGGVSPRMQTRAPSSTLADALQTPFERSLITSGLTSYRGAGEIESPESGGKRRNVWNEASLRLKDALGI